MMVSAEAVYPHHLLRAVQQQDCVHDGFVLAYGAAVRAEEDGDVSKALDEEVPDHGRRELGHAEAHVAARPQQLGVLS